MFVCNKMSQEVNVPGNNGKSKVYLIGIGGHSMSGLAKIYSQMGYSVYGSDHSNVSCISELQKMGITVFPKHSARNLSKTLDLVVASGAVPDENIEIQAAKRRRLHFLRRSQALSELINSLSGITIAGTHGKSTTSAMIAWILQQAGMDPSFLLGAIPRNFGVNGYWGTGPFVFETDEWDGVISLVQPYIAVVTNVEYDHPDIYETVEDYKKVFIDYIEKCKPDGLIVLPDNIPWLLAAAKKTGRNLVITGTENQKADWTASKIEYLKNGGVCFNVNFQGNDLGKISLKVSGKHNVLNALNAIAVASAMKISLSKIFLALECFSGVQSRFEILGQCNGTLVISDFVGHPTEANMTIQAALQYEPRRLRCVYLANAYHENPNFIETLGSSFLAADEILIPNLMGMNDDGDIVSEDTSYVATYLAQYLKKVYHFENYEEAARSLANSSLPGDIILTLGPCASNPVAESLISFWGDRFNKFDVTTSTDKWF